MTRFSQRYETRRPQEGLRYEEIPPRVFDGYSNLVQMTTGVSRDDYPSQLVIELCQALDRVGSDGSTLQDLLDDLDWDEFLDLCEVTHTVLTNLGGADRFSNGLNALFARHYVGYELRNGQIERVGGRAQEEAIANARGILRDPDLRGPDEQFQKAINFFSLRPNPDLENCVKEAVSAVEGVAQILLEDNSLTLSKALARLKSERDVHPTLIGLLEKLYAYRGDAEGVGHALTGTKEVRLEDAELAMSISASAIVYLARLYGRAVN